MLPHIEDISSYAGRVVVYVILFLLALVLLEVGADIFVDSTAIVAKRHHIPQVLIALLTAGAEWEELAVVISAIAQGNPELALGNIIGPCISNILGAVYCSPKLLKWIEAPSSMGEALDKPSGGVLIALFAVYLGSIGYGIYQGVMAEPEDSDSDSDSDDNQWNNDTAPASPERRESQDKLLTRARARLRQLKRTTTYHVIALIFGDEETFLSFLGCVNIAARLVKEKYPDAQLYEVTAMPPTPHVVTSPYALSQLSLVFRTGTGTAFISSTGWGEFAPVTHVDEPWLEDVIIPLPVKMEATEADMLMKKAGYTGRYGRMTLRHPLYPGIDEPYYIFSMESGEFVFVGVNDKMVTVNHARQDIPPAVCDALLAQRAQ